MTKSIDEWADKDCGADESLKRCVFKLSESGMDWDDIAYVVCLPLSELLERPAIYDFYKNAEEE